ncbi:putative tyrosine carboxypeptidase MATCAP2 isoform X2 [Mixophyes fleayi]|uniref:putative tyrosine carboxypeptidase MATCAP2 isoform X2 n=1 Tax=Mixophyes fleayi TaxID=3061075 RepID=UPI003F4E1BB0
MLESLRITEVLRWPKEELSRKSVLKVEKARILATTKSIKERSKSILRDTFRTGTSSYNILLQSKEEKSESVLAQNKKQRKASKMLSTSSRKECNKIQASPHNNTSLCAKWSMSSFNAKTRETSAKYPKNILVAGNHVRLANKPNNNVRRKHDLPNPATGKEPYVSKTQAKEDLSGKKNCILNAIKPINVEKEKTKFFKSAFTYNPQFEYANPALPSVLAKHSISSDRFLKQAVSIMLKTLEKYGSYEKFEQATGGNLLPKSRIWQHVRKYMKAEGCLGEIVVHLTDDLLSRASMTVVNGRPTLTINISTAREQWLEGILRHEIGTHYFRGMNNSQQPWNNSDGRKKHDLKPVNPTEEGLASIHSVLFRKDPFLWRAALLYYTVYQASIMSFSELFQDVGQFVKDPNTRWDYCVRAKRGCTDTSQPASTDSKCVPLSTDLTFGKT